MENTVKDAITEGTTDKTLSILLEVVRISITEDRLLFPNPLDEPVFYRRYFVPWVKEGLEEAKAIAEAEAQAMAKVQHPQD
jgi:hypothetical protein